MKKGLLIFLVVGILFMLAIIVLPTLYKDEIRAKLTSEINKQVNAQVYFKDYDLGIIRNFPNLTASLNDFGIVNKAPFEGDTLMAVKSFNLGINLWSVIKGDQIKINSIQLDNPKLNIRVLKDGSANYDIMKPQPEEEKPETDTTTFSAGIEKWEITNGFVSYKDDLQKAYLTIQNLNHEGKGDFTQDIFDLSTNTSIDSLTVDFDGTNYFKKKTLHADLTLEMNMPESKYTFKENTVRINDFGFGFDGFFKMPEQGYVMDINFHAKENDFKNILSIVPGVYMQDFKDIETKGTMAFDGFVKGVYDDTKNQMPAFNVKLLVKDAMFKYPKLPMPVDAINVDMEVDNKDGVIDNTLIDIRDFRMKLGQNPVSGKVRVKGLTNYAVNADVKAKVNLAQMSQVFPMPGTTLKGIYDLKLLADGVYSDANKTIPKIDAYMTITDGYVKSDQYPIPMENITLASDVKNTTGKMADTRVNVEKLSMLVEGKPFMANGHFHNLDDLEYDVMVKGEADLEKMTKIYPIEGMKLTGLMNADITTKGKLSDAQAQRYDKLPTSGVMTLKNFTYWSQDVPQGVKITDALLSFTPQRMTLERYTGFLGKSDVALKGEISNYIAYLLDDKSVLKGNMNLTSSKFDVNEWMTEEPEAQPEPEEELAVVEVPKNIDFTFDSKINEMQYTNMTMTEAKGIMIVREGILRLNGFGFNMFGGNFVANGTYDTREMAKPLFDFDLDIKDLSIPKAFETFATVRAFAPIARNMIGNFSTKFKINGELAQNLMPVFQTLTGGGLISLKDVEMQGVEALTKVASVTQLKDLTPARLKDVLMKAEIKNGRMFLQPTDLKVSNYAANITGSTGMDGTIDYLMQLTVPKNKAAMLASAKLDSITGGSQGANENVKLNLKIGGSYTAPIVSLAKGGTEEAIKQEMKEKIAEQKEVVKETVKETAKDVAKETIKDIFDKDTASNKTPTDKAKEKAVDALNKLKGGFFGKKKKEETQQPQENTGGTTTGN